MKKTMMILAATASFAVAGCQNMTQDQRFATGALGGGAAGLAAAEALDSNRTGQVVGMLAGAAAGSAIGANRGQGQAQQAPRCQYADGSVGPCPRSYY